MVRRLVLGSGSIGHAVIEELSARPGDLRVIEADENRVEALRGEGIAADHGDPADRALLDASDPPDITLVAGDDTGTNWRATQAAREAFPGTHLIAYTGVGGDDREGRFAAVADRTIDHTGSIADAVLLAATGDSGTRLRALTRMLRGIDGRLGVFMHNDPDPDAMGSALALREIARAHGLEAEACYFGEIAHQENQALVNLLDLDLRRIEPDGLDLDRYGGIALVDHSRPGVNDGLPPETPVDVVIDHHPPRGPVDAGLVDLRSDVGATSTLLVGYLDALGIDVDERVATALLYGIRVDTRDFGREITGADFEAASLLLPKARMDILERVESPGISGDTLDTVGRAIRNAQREGAILISSAGRVNNRDAVAQAADQLLAMEGVSLTVVFGIIGETVYASGRTRGSPIDIGETMRRAFADIGSAGGHSDMAGAQLSIGILGDVREGSESLEAVVADVITGRLFEELDVNGPLSSTATTLEAVADAPDDDTWEE